MLTPVVMLVDDDQEMRESLVWLLESNDLSVRAFSSPDEVIENYDPQLPGCLLIDLQLPGISGLELWQTLSEMGGRHPFIIISGHGNVETAVQTMHLGAVDFIEKPFDRKRLLARVHEAILVDAENRRKSAKFEETQRRIDSLTPREHEVMGLVTAGLLTKQIARKLGISEKTVEVHRSHVTKKMHVHSVAQLVALVSRNQHLSPKCDQQT
jgi:FixJ family two-component response regulator